MYFKILINFILAIFLFVIQAGFINTIHILDYLNLVLVVLVFILVLSNLNWSIFWFLFLALCFDVFSFHSFGIHLITYGLVLIVVYVLVVNFFTNRSLYSFLVLIGIATLVYNLALQSMNYIFNFSEKINFSINFWFDFGWRLLANLSATILIFYILNFFFKQFNPVFLRKKFLR